MAFTAPQRADLADALIAAFNRGTLDIAVRDHLGPRLDVITANANFQEVVKELLDWAEAQGFERAVVRMTLEANPGHQKIVAFMEHHREFPAFLVPEQRERFRAGLFNVVKTVGDLRALLTPPLATQPAGFLDNAADASSAETYLPLLIRLSDHFGFVLLLIERVLERFPANAVLESQVRPLMASIRSREPAAGAASTNPFDACDLDGTLMIDRAPLRQAMRGLSGGGNPRIVGVAGDARSGKTHSKYFIQHISEKEQTYDAVIVDLNDEAPATFRPDQLIKRIVRGWGRNDLVASIPTRDPVEVEARWVIDLAGFLVGEVRKSQRLLVVVLDGFANEKLHLLTHELLTKLVRMASVEKYLRLVLLHYPDEVLANEPPGRIETHRIAPLSETDVRNFVSAYAMTSAGEAPPPESIDLIVSNVFANPTPTTNEEVALRVDRFLREVMQP